MFRPARTRRLLGVLPLTLAIALGTQGLTAPAQAVPVLTPEDDPLIIGVPRLGGPLSVIAGEYSSDPDDLEYQWYADGLPVGADLPIYRPTADDVAKTMTVAVTATLASAEVTTVATASTPVRNGGTVTAWGRNDHGQARVPGELHGRTVTEVAAGSDHSLALTAEGGIVAFGSDSYGETDVPAGLAGKNVIAIDSRAYDSIALADDGTVAVWGPGWGGQGTVPSSLDGQEVVAVAAGTNHYLALASDGTLTAWGLGAHGQASVPAHLAGKEVVAIAAGSDHNLAITSDGVLTAWGSNSHQQTTVEAVVAGETVVAAAGGSAHSLAVTGDGAVTGAGWDEHGQSTVPSRLDGRPVVAVAGGWWHSLALLSDGSLDAWGASENGQATIPAGLADRPVSAIAAAGQHSLALVPSLSVAAPTIAGTAQVGQTLTATAGTITPSPDSISYTWRADGVAIAGADQATYTLTPAEAGARITVTTTATGPGHAPTSATSAPTAAVATVPFTTVPTPAIAGTAQVGQTLTAVAGTFVPTPGAIGYAWHADGVAIAGADRATYTLTAAEAGAEITVTTTATKAGYAAATETSLPVGPVADRPVAGAAPRLTLTAETTRLRRGQGTRLTWAATGATTVRATGRWRGTRNPRGTLAIEPRRLGTAVYRLTATNEHGTTTAQVAVTVTRPARTLPVRVVGHQHGGGDRVRVVARLASGERYTIRVGSRVVARGIAPRRGSAPTGVSVRRTVTLPRATRERQYRIRVIGATSDRRGSTTVRVGATTDLR